MSNTVVQLIQLEDTIRQNGRTELLSPLLVQTCAWFLSRWSQTYLLPSDNATISNNLNAAYGPGGGAESVLSFIISRSNSNFTNWGSEEDVVQATCSLLVALSGRKAVARILLSTDSWMPLIQIVRGQLSKQPGVRWLAPQHLTPLMQALCTTVAVVEEPAQRTNMLRELIGPVIETLGQLMAHTKQR